MGTQNPGQHEPGAVRRKLSRLFREREILLRSEGRVRYFKLRPGVQASFACVFFAVGLWLAGANGYAWWQDRIIQSKETEILEARVAYDRLRGELHEYQNRVAVLANGILEQQDSGERSDSLDLEALTQVAEGIESAFERINRDLDLTEADRLRIIQSRDSLHQRIAELEDSLESSHHRIAGLESEVETRDDSLAVERAAIASLRSSRDDWRGRAETLSGDLNSARERIESLDAELGETYAALSEERERVETLSEVRDRLDRQVATLQTGLDAAQVRGERLAGDLQYLAQSVATLESERMAIDGERAALDADLNVLEAELSLHQAATDETRKRLEAVVGSLSELTAPENDISDVENMNALQALEIQIAELSSELVFARGSAADMEGAIGDVVVELSRVVGTDPTSLAEADAPAERVNMTRDLLGTVRQVQDDQLDLIQRLIGQTEQEIARHEALILMTDMDVDHLLTLSGFETGVGGPLELVVASGPRDHHLGAAPVPDTGQLAEEVDILESRLQRMEALSDLMTCMPLVSPIDNFQLTSEYGPRRDPINGQNAFHHGIDIGGWSGIPVHATAGGVVTRAERNGGYGYMVVVDHGCGISTVYAHLRRIEVSVGDEISHRDVVGTLGSTGRSTGPHVHYEVRIDGDQVDPLPFIEAGRHVHKI